MNDKKQTKSRAKKKKVAFVNYSAASMVSEPIRVRSPAFPIRQEMLML
jgi:hypothetical protein